MLTKLGAKNKSLSVEIDFVANCVDESDPQKVSVMVGPNGSRKSLILRMLCEAALGKSSYRSSGKPAINLYPLWQGQLPKKLICISGTPLDRFPRPRPRLNQPTVRRNTGDINYVCFGPRGVKGSSGVRSNERALVWTLLRNRTQRISNETSLEAAFTNIGLKPTVYIYLEPTSKFEQLISFNRRPIDSISVSDVADALRLAITTNNGGADEVAFTGDVRYLNRNWDDSYVAEAADQILDLIRNSTKAQILIDGRRVMKRKGTLSLTLWKSLMTLGILDVAKTEFVSLHESLKKRISSEELSSGQWSWLSSFCGIFAEMEDRTLLLIDEPENSLHPQWQRRYMQSLLEGINGYKNCQVVLATHSPFIAAGLPPSIGCVVQLITDQRDEHISVRSEIIGNLFGWRAGDVYERAFDIESTRDESFMSSANQALAAIRDKRKLKFARIDELKSTLKGDEEQLPLDDPMRSILSQIRLELDDLGTP